jgi:hypothetical protein
VFLALAATACRDDERGEPAGTGGLRGTGGSAGWAEQGRLPTAFVGVPYRFEFVPARAESGSALEGGFEPAEAGRRFHLLSGELPAGLAWAPPGVLEGTPEREGETDLLVRDEARGVAFPLRLRVSRKRWLAYRSDERALGQHLLYLVDLSSEARVFPLVRDAQIRAEVLPGQYRFAPQEEALAFLVDAQRDGVRELHGVDLSGNRPGASLRLDHGAPVRDFAWSPDGRRIAYVSEEHGSLEVSLIDWPFEGGRIALGSAGGAGRLSWVHSGLLLTDARGGGSQTWRVAPRGVEPEEKRTPGGRVLWASGERALLSEELYLCAGSFHQVQFDRTRGDVRGAAGEESAPPQGDERTSRAAPPVRDGFVVADETLRYLRSGQVVDAQPLASCDALTWGPDGHTLLSIDAAQRLRLTRAPWGPSATSERPSLEHHLVPGTYGPVLSRPRPALSASGDWLRFHVGSAVFVSRVVDGRPSPAQSVSDAVGLSGARVIDSVFGSPSIASTLFLLAEFEDTARVVAVDLAATPPRSRVLFQGSAATDRPVAFVGGLADGSWLGIELQEASPPASESARRKLRLVPTTPSPAQGSWVVGEGLDCVPERELGPPARIRAVRCESIADARFQP